jgi:DNA-binding transcriptional ArsR family regulator
VNNLNSIFSALADPTRRGILARLAQGESTVGELACPFDVSLPAISRHLRVLESAALIVRERRGKHRVCRLDARAMAGASQWLDFYSRFWNESFDRLDKNLKQTRHLKQGKGWSIASTKKR